MRDITKTDTYKPHTREWFKERIGKRIYRDSDSCPCLVCREIVENGLIVADEDHADYLEMCDNEWAIEGHFLNYRDEK